MIGRAVIIIVPYYWKPLLKKTIYWNFLQSRELVFFRRNKRQRKARSKFNAPIEYKVYYGFTTAYKFQEDTTAVSIMGVVSLMRMGFGGQSPSLQAA
jgi:hypothetical protein